MPNHPLLSNPHAIALGPLTTGVPYGPRWVPMGQAVYFFSKKKTLGQAAGPYGKETERGAALLLVIDFASNSDDPNQATYW